MSVAGSSTDVTTPDSQPFWDYLYQLQLQSRLCDIELCIREMAVSGEFVVMHSIPAHKLVVAGCSQFFRRCLQNGQLLDMYNFDGVQPQNLQTLIGYMYHQIPWQVMMANPEAAEVAQILEIIPHDDSNKLSVQPKSPHSSNVLVVQMQDKNAAQLDEGSLNIVKQAAIGGLGTTNPQLETLPKNERVLIHNLQEELRRHNIGRHKKEVMVLTPEVLQSQETERDRHNSPLVVPQVELADPTRSQKIARVEVEPMSPVPVPPEGPVSETIQADSSGGEGEGHIQEMVTVALETSGEQESHENLVLITETGRALEENCTKKGFSGNTDADSSAEVHSMTGIYSANDEAETSRNISQTSTNETFPEKIAADSVQVKQESRKPGTPVDESPSENKPIATKKHDTRSTAKSGYNFKIQKVLKTPVKTEIVVIKPEKMPSNSPAPSADTLQSASPYSTRYRGQKRVVVASPNGQGKRTRVDDSANDGKYGQSRRLTRSHVQGVDGTVDEHVDDRFLGTSGPEAESQHVSDEHEKFSDGQSVRDNETSDDRAFVQTTQETPEDATEESEETWVRIKLESDSDEAEDIPNMRSTAPLPEPSTAEPQSDDATADRTDSTPVFKLPRGRPGRKGRVGVKEVERTLPHACTDCGKRFKNSTGLSIHMQWKHSEDANKKREGQTDYTCVLCGKVCACYQALVQHMRMKHASNPVHECVDCQQYFQNIRDYRSHRITSHGDVFYHCDFCDVSFKSPEGHKIHMFKKHTQAESNHMCTVCGKKFKMKHELAVHLRSTHASERAFKCQLCTRAFKNKGPLKRHLLTYHTNSKTVPCPECYLLFKTKGDMKAHLKKHFRVKNPLPKDPSILPKQGPFICEKCNKTFERKQQWLYHDRQVHGDGTEMVYICTMCKKSYTAKNYLLAHIRQAHLPKRFKCHQCLYEFTHAYMIRKHMPKCRGSPVNLRPYKCNGCGKYFNLKGNLTRHIRSEGKCRGMAHTDTDYIVVLTNNRKYTSASVVERIASVEGVSGETTVSVEALQASEALQQLQASGGPELQDSAAMSDILRVEVDGEVPTDQLMYTDDDIEPSDLQIHDGPEESTSDLQKPAVAAQIHVKDDENLQETIAQLSSLKDVVSLPGGLSTVNVQKDEFGNIVIEVSSAEGEGLEQVQVLEATDAEPVTVRDSQADHLEVVEESAYIVHELIPAQETEEFASSHDSIQVQEINITTATSN